MTLMSYLLFCNIAAKEREEKTNCSWVRATRGCSHSVRYCTADWRLPTSGSTPTTCRPSTATWKLTQAVATMLEK